jgi:hypothetical protein
MTLFIYINRLGAGRGLEWPSFRSFKKYKSERGSRAFAIHRV